MLMLNQLGGFSARERGPTITSGLVGWWNLNDGTGSSAVDSSGNGRTGTLTGSPTWASGAAGFGGLSLNGSSQYVSIADNAAFSPATTGAFSVMCWAYIVTTTGYLIAKSDAAGQYEFGLQPGGITVWQLIGSTHALASATAPPTSQWSHFAMTFQSATALKFYINGTEAATSSSFTGSIADGTGPVNIGRRPDNTGYENATICDARIYNRALTAIEINSIANFDG